MKGRAIILAALLVSAAPANAVYFTYSQWESLPASMRAAYIAGMYDALTSFSDNDEGAAYARHYQACVSTAKMSTGQMAENVRIFASSRPELQGPSVGGAFIKYLVSLCGSQPR